MDHQPSSKQVLTTNQSEKRRGTGFWVRLGLKLDYSACDSPRAIDNPSPNTTLTAIVTLTITLRHKPWPRRTGQRPPGARWKDRLGRERARERGREARVRARREIPGERGEKGVRELARERARVCEGKARGTQNGPTSSSATAPSVKERREES
eukprot:1344649-Amorphochlora_amoeboformis.AAC.1